LTCHPEVFPGTLPERENVPVFNDSATLSMMNSFVPNEADRRSPLVSPLLADPALIKKLAPAYIDVCSADPLYTGGVAYAKKLEENGVAVKLFILEGMPHGSYILFPDLPSSQTAHTACMQGTEWALKSPN
jgi:acetyl esterase/lipase